MKNSAQILIEIAKLPINTDFTKKNSEEKTQWLLKNYQVFFREEINCLNVELIEKGVDENLTHRANNYLTALDKIRQHITRANFLFFLENCSLTKNEAQIIEKSLQKEGLNQNILNIVVDILEKKSIDSLRQYRESPQARKDIKNPINDENLDSIGFLKPILMFLNSDIAPSIRMELWQKFELYFNSGWGFDDLTKNSSNSETAKQLKKLLDASKNKKSIGLHSSEGQEILKLLSQRITQLGVPIKISNKVNINNEKIPTATVQRDMQYVYDAKKVTAAGFVDWAIPDFHDKTVLHFSLATSDETLNIENSQLFRYNHAINNMINETGEFSKAKMYFFSVSSFYDDMSADSQIGQEFLSRFSIQAEERKLLNLLPFLSMTDTVNSNYSTGIYSPNQLVDYNFCLIGAQSIIENNKKYDIEQLFRNCIETAIDVLNRDKRPDKYSDIKTQQIITYLSKMLSCAQNEFYENESLMQYLFDDNTVEKLNNIRKKLPDAIQKSGFIGKNDFQRLIDSLDGQDPLKFKRRQNMRKAEALEEQGRVEKLEKLAQKVMQLKELGTYYDNILNENTVLDCTVHEWIALTDEQRVEKYKLLFLEKVYSPLEDGRSKRFKTKTINNLNESTNTLFFKDIALDTTKTFISNFDRKEYPHITYYKRRALFEQLEKQRYETIGHLLLDSYSFLDDDNYHKDNNLLTKLTYSLMKEGNCENIKNIKLPSSYLLEKYSLVTKNCSLYQINEDIKQLNGLRNILRKEDINNIMNHNAYIDTSRDEIIQEIRKHYSHDDIAFIEEKLQVKFNNKLSIKK